MTDPFERELVSQMRHELDALPPGLEDGIRARIARPGNVRTRGEARKTALFAILIAIAAVGGIALFGRLPSTAAPASVVADATSSVTPVGSTPTNADVRQTGQTWSELGDVSVGMGARLVSADVGWVVVENGIRRTADGGKTWTEVESLDPTTLSVRGVQFVNERTAYLVEGLDPILVTSTSDGGRSWKTASTGIFVGPEGGARVVFADARTGYLLTRKTGSHVYAARVTTDGAETWTELKTTLPPSQCCPLQTASAGAFFIAMGKSDFKPFEDRFPYTRDGGVTWTTANYPAFKDMTPGELKMIVALDISGSRLIMGMTGADDPKRTSSTGVFLSEDGGSTWELRSPVLPDSTSWYYQFAIIDDANWVMLASDGSQAWSTTDGGDHWRHVEGAESDKDGLDDPSFVSVDQGWVVQSCVADPHVIGPDCWDDDRTGGQLIATADGGATWTLLTP